MRIIRRLALVAGATLLSVGAVGAPASAAPSTEVPVNGGTTSVTVDPGVTRYLLNNRILPYATDASTRLVWTSSGWTVRYGFPITDGSSVTLTGGSVSAADIGHTGGIRFVNLRNFKALKVGNFDISISSAGAYLYATTVNNQPVAGPGVPVFELRPTSLVPTITSDGFAVVSKVGLVLTGAAASALNTSLHTSAFAGGIEFGTATVRADITP
jgi:hypothetical protein